MRDDPPIIPPGETLPPLRTDAERHRRDESDRGSTRPRRHRDRFGVLNGFVDCSMAGLSRAEALAWFVLYRDTRNGTARTSHAAIARRIGTTRRTVTGAVGRLRRRGLLTLVYRGGLNRGASVYRVRPLPGEP